MLLGSLTAVTWPCVGAGLVGYVPLPKVVLRVSTFSWFVRLNPSAMIASVRRLPSENPRLTRRLRLRYGVPRPAFLSINAPFTIGRPAVPWTVVTPELMLNGYAEYARSVPLASNPCATRCHVVIPGSVEVRAEPLIASR